VTKKTCMTCRHYSKLMKTIGNKEFQEPCLGCWMMIDKEFFARYEPMEGGTEADEYAKKTITDPNDIL